MTLTIDRLLVRGKIPRRSKVALIDRFAPDEFSAECSRRLNGRWPLQTQVARIRQLRVQVKIPASQLQPDAFVKAWTAAFLHELFAALARLHSVEMIQFQSRAEYVAAAIRDLLNGDAGQRWIYEEFEHLFNTGTSEAVLSLFKREQTEIIPILLILQDWGLLDRLLSVWDEAGFEQFFLVLTNESDIRSKKLSIEELIRAARLLLECHSGEIEPAGGSSRPQAKIALKLFLRSARQSNRVADRMLLPGTLFRALRILGAFLDLFNSAKSKLCLQTDFGSSAWDSVLLGVLPGSALDIRNSIPAWSEGNQTSVIELLNKLRSIASSGTRQDLLNEFWSLIAAAPDSSRAGFAEVLHKLTSSTSSNSQRQELAELWNVIATGSSRDRTALAALFSDLSSTRNHSIQSNWISTDCAGLFLLVRVLRIIGWEDRLARSPLSSIYGERLLTYTLAAIASAILGRFSDQPAYVESGIALFSGWMDTPDLRGFRAFLAAGSIETRRDLLQELLGEERAVEYSASWRTCFDALANRLIQEFTEQIRCFGKPSRSFVVKKFVVLPGRIRIEEKRLVVVLTSSPLHVVIHLSGLDDPVEAVSWLGGRQIEFQADGF